MEIKGIDVSSWQGSIDWKTVSDYGMGFAILRITEKGNKIDSQFENNYGGCTKYNIPVGVYKYSYATTISQIKDEANIVIKTLNNRKLDYPVFLDLEDDCQKNITRSTMMQMINTFRSIIIDAGYKFGIYCGKYWYDSYLPEEAKKYDCWLAAYPSDDQGWLVERLRPSVGIGWQYSSKARIPGISGYVDRDVFYKDYTENVGNTEKEEGNTEMTKEQMIQNVINDAVDFATKIAKDNSHGYSQAVRSLYNITNPSSFDCSSLVCTAYYYAFKKNGVTPTPKDLGCSYTGNMMNLTKCGFEVVARNQTAHAEMKKGDIELNTTYHTALAIDKDNIVHARSSEGTSDTKDNSGNEIRIQPWYLYSHGWTCRLRFTGKGVNFSGIVSDITTPTTTPSKNYLEYGDQGSDVKSLQQKLNKVGIKDPNGNKLEEDGSFGDATLYAVKVFQQKYGLEVDGLAGKDTISKLDSLIASQTNSNNTGFKSFVGACTTDSTPVYAAKIGDGVLATYPMLNRANLVDVIAKSGTRYQIRIANKYIGWIAVSRIVKPEDLDNTKPAYPFVGECVANNVSVLVDAGPDYTKLPCYPILNKGDLVEALTSKRGTDKKAWFQVKIGGAHIGYVRSDYIKKK